MRRGQKRRNKFLRKLLISDLAVMAISLVMIAGLMDISAYTGENTTAGIVMWLIIGIISLVWFLLFIMINGKDTIKKMFSDFPEL